MKSTLASPASTERSGENSGVPFFDQSETFRRIWPEIRGHCSRVLDDGKFSHGSMVAEFERALERYTGARHAVGVNSGTDALVLLLRAAGLRPGDEVIVPAHTFVATATAVVHAGGVPVFADIEEHGYGIDPDAVAAAVTDRTRMVMPVHLFDRLADMVGVRRVADAHGLTVVEDSAEAIGMRSGGTHAGLLGTGGVLSFFPAKTLGAVGDAGALLTDDDAVAETARMLRHHGRSGRTLAAFPGISNPTVVTGGNSKMDDLQAAVLLAKLAHLDADIERRAVLSRRYDDRLRGLPGVRAVPGDLPVRPGENRVVYVHLVQVDDRDGLAARLAAAGIGTEVYYPRPLHLQPCFAHLGYRPGDLPRAEELCRTALALPLYPDLAEEAVDRVCDEIERHYSGRSR
ncbi:DegT/DnrJ/EryC1/StrS family aminotransferase [Nocardiopsis changdeensis]|uniref:DegT/DnrJ/EryC1/StrS family aminotransferase n=1 Tax=Nocardiopsis changdeensis TaxID=2831969 RepID=A0ABX8BE20_9ACTN|nr:MULTISPECIES: DegT/DnrJ/EryC1/StrS family aminotransferase [Nocardiopsis]QUX20490.1 DegT/DnrJ/EryC1/StrS family aminotransferase [Nocardiopsis changdeensis]QYX36421.1 DegT/DnrJ/EryC1/StrS family aminotransferase [Nocardiopsis sp. MT53]